MSGRSTAAAAAAAAGGAASSLTDETIDKFVLSYLRSRGYARAEDVFRQQLQAEGLDQFAHSLSIECHATMVQQILQGYNMQQQSPEWYAEAFQGLHSWIEGSLDMYRSELHGVLFPLFLHCYFELVLKGFPYDAASFMEKFRGEFEARHSREIQSVIGIHYPDQIEGNTTAKRFRSYKVDVLLSSYSHQLLLSFLQESKLYLLLKIINEHINLSVMTAKPIQHSATSRSDSNTGATTTTALEITGLSISDIDAMNSKEVEWGLLTSVAEIMAAEEAKSARAVAAVDAPASLDAVDMDTSEAGGAEAAAPAPKKAKLAEPSLAPSHHAESRIPLPPITAQMKQEIISGLHYRQKLSPAARSNPTICCYTFLNSSESLNRICISRDSRVTTAGYSDSSIKVWDLERSRDASESAVNSPPYQSLIGHSGPIFGLDITADNRYLLSSSDDGTARLWSLRENLGLVAYKGHNYPVWDVKFSPLDFYFVTGSHDRTARLWSTERIFPLRIFAGHISDVDCVAFHPNCNYVLTGSTDKSIRFWDIQSGECCRIFRGHNSSVRSIALSPCGRYAASGDVAGHVKVFDLGTALQVAEYNPDSGEGHTNAVTCLEWSIDGSQIASGSLDSTVRIWKAPKSAAQTSSPAASILSAPRPYDLSQSHVFHTKSTPISTLRYTQSNVLLVGGVFRP